MLIDRAVLSPSVFQENRNFPVNGPWCLGCARAIFRVSGDTLRLVNQVLAPWPQLILLLSLLGKGQDPSKREDVLCQAPALTGPKTFRTGWSSWSRALVPEAGPLGSGWLVVLLREAIARLLLEEIAEPPVCANEQGGMRPHTEQTLSRALSRAGHGGGKHLGASSQLRAGTGASLPQACGGPWDRGCGS